MCFRPNIVLTHTSGKRKFLSGQLYDSSTAPTYFIPRKDYVPCLKCEQCILENRYSKALRITLESKEFKHTYFITTTYNDQNQDSEILNHNHYRQFADKLRTFLGRQKRITSIKVRGRFKKKLVTLKQIKTVMCGEYGGKFGRRHFHMILFTDTPFNDIIPTGTYSEKGNPNHTSKTLEKIWNKGYVTIEPLTFDLALYVSHYLSDGDKDQGDYGRLGKNIGRTFAEKYPQDCLQPQITLLIDGTYRSFPTPRYLREHASRKLPVTFKQTKQKKWIDSVKKQELLLAKGDGLLHRSNNKKLIWESKPKRIK